jgi:hypothetical protein
MTDNQKAADNQAVQGTYVPENFKLHGWLLKTDLSMGAKLTYSVLACCCNGRDHVWPSQNFLAKCLSASVRTVQRYLKELVDFGLITITKKYLMGKKRSIYSFLNHALVSFEPKSPKAAALARPKKPGNAAPAQTTKTAKSCDKNDTALNKVESYEGLNIPPAPQTEDSGSPADLPSVCDDSGKGEDIFFEPEEDQSVRSAELEEDPAWKEAKEALAARLSDFDLKAWIEPLRFERSGSEAVLRLPNRFFLAQVRNKFGHELSAAFQKAGFIDLRFEEMTPEQKEAFAKRCEAERLRNLKAQSPPPKPQEPTDFEKLSLEEKFNRLYEAYPVKKDRVNAWAVFRKLDRKKALPAIAKLLASIKDHQNRDRWWREKMPPLLANWLAKGKWEDKPYE